MGTKKTGNNRYLKQLNEAVILDLIRINKAMSKAELAKVTGLSPTAVGVIMSSLIDKDFLLETGIGESSGGRKPVLYELKPKSCYSIGIDLDVNYFGLILIDITGEIIWETSSVSIDTRNTSRTLEVICDQIDMMIKNFGVKKEKLLGIGISIPGLVDSNTHKVILAPNLEWTDFDIEGYFNSRYDTQVFTENEAMASAICEGWLGECQGIDDFICINVKSGIGAGIMTRGKPYRGTGGSAGEVGHIAVDENGPKCGCGNYGCLETLASEGRIVEQVRKLVRQGTASKLNHVENIEDITIGLIIAAAGSGDEEAKKILLESARYLAIAISNLVNILNPSKVVIGKDFVRYSDLVLDYIKDLVSKKALKYPASLVDITASKIGEKASVMGAAIIPLKILFGR